MSDHVKLSDLHISLMRAGNDTGCPVLDLRPAVDLRRAAMRLQSLNELACNGVMRWDEKARRVLPQWNERDESRNEAATERARGKARAAVDAIFGERWDEYFELEFQRDPRGAAIKLHSAGKTRGWTPLVAVY